MLSKYFTLKTESKDFEEHLLNLICELKDKRVLLYGAGQGFKEINKKHSITEKLNIVGIADKRFENGTELKPFEGIRPVLPSNIPNEDYDVILVTNERVEPIVKFLKDKLEISEDVIKQIFVEQIKDEAMNTNYLCEYKFEKTLPKLIKKLKNKSVILYGAGSFLELVNKYYDLSELNIIGVSDKRFFHHEENEKWQGYKVFSINEAIEANPDYILVATKYYINIIEDLYYNSLKGTNIKIKPLLKKPFFTLVKEIWN